MLLPKIYSQLMKRTIEDDELVLFRVMISSIILNCKWTGKRIAVITDNDQRERIDRLRNSILKMIYNIFFWGMMLMIGRGKPVSTS